MILRARVQKSTIFSTKLSFPRLQAQNPTPACCQLRQRKVKMKKSSFRAFGRDWRFGDTTNRLQRVCGCIWHALGVHSCTSHALRSRNSKTIEIFGCRTPHSRYIRLCMVPAKAKEGQNTEIKFLSPKGQNVKMAKCVRAYQPTQTCL